MGRSIDTPRPWLGLLAAALALLGCAPSNRLGQPVAIARLPARPDDEPVWGRTARFWKQMAFSGVRALWLSYGEPCLVLHGTADVDSVPYAGVRRAADEVAAAYDADLRLRTFRTEHGAEVDLGVEGEDLLWAIECKASENVGPADLRGFASLIGRRRHRCVVAYLGRARRHLSGVDILPWQDVLRELAATL